jgi:PTS system ascorbate-specific IIC component
MITLFAAFLVPTMSAIGFQNTTFGDADFQWFGFAVGQIAAIKDVAAAIGVVVLCVVLIGLAWLFQKRYVDTNWVPGGESAAETESGEAAARA